MTPFLRWPGGKRWLVDQIDKILPSSFERYIEPFLGGGSVYFHLQPSKAILSDINAELIATYSAIKSDWKKVVRNLKNHQSRHCDEHYYKIRDRLARSKFDAAARMIYLNRTCFNGLYRTNREGRFNVPRGDRSDVIRGNDDFQGCAALLASARLHVGDFEKTIDLAVEGDLVFADPPYTVRHNLNGFLRYNEKLFSWDDQCRLARSLQRASSRGAFIVCTNANHKSLRELYSGSSFRLRELARTTSLSADIEFRGKTTELVFFSGDSSKR